MGNTKIPKADLPKLADIYKREGRNRLNQVIKDEYQVTNISNVIKRMKAISLIENNTAEIKSTPEEVFLSIDELCSPAEKSQSQKHENAYEDNRSDAMKKLIQELIGDRLLELSRYISVNSISKTLIVDKTSLTNDGYQIMMH